jgi:hypothetical protein
MPILIGRAGCSPVPHAPVENRRHTANQDRLLTTSSFGSARTERIAGTVKGYRKSHSGDRALSLCQILPHKKKGGRAVRISRATRRRDVGMFPHFLRVIPATD